MNAALVAQRQNEEITSLTEAGYEQNEQVKRISSWAAILFAPTLVASIYGMNFDHMPELGWRLGYPFALLLMVLLGAGSTPSSDAAAGSERARALGTGLRLEGRLEGPTRVRRPLSCQRGSVERGARCT